MPILVGCWKPPVRGGDRTVGMHGGDAPVPLGPANPCPPPRLVYPVGPKYTACPAPECSPSGMPRAPPLGIPRLSLPSPPGLGGGEQGAEHHRIPMGREGKGVKKGFKKFTCPVTFSLEFLCTCVGGGRPAPKTPPTPPPAPHLPSSAAVPLRL